MTDHQALFSESPWSQDYGIALRQPSRHVPDIAAALLAMGFRAHDVDLVLAYQQATGLGPSDAIHEVGVGTGEDICRAHALVSDLPYLTRETANTLRLATVRPFAPQIGDDAQPEFCPIAAITQSDHYDVLYAITDPGQVNAVRNFAFPRMVDNRKIRPRCCLASRLVVERLYRREIRDAATEFDEALTRGTDEGRYRLALKALLMHASYSGASDIHFDPLPAAGLIRLRVDGILTVFRVVRRDPNNRDGEESVFDRLVGLIGQDIKIKDPRGQAEGALNTEVPPALEGKYQYRVEMMATIHGLGAVIRILDRSGETTDFANLGLDDTAVATLKRYAQSSSGLVIATGPTGSGKTTLINSLMRTIDAVRTSVQTIENPVEVQVGVWRQHETRRLDGGDSESKEWIRWFKGMLRNDPDVVLLGEVRDADVARVALDMANTGHLVFTTLHASSAPLACSRLREMRSPLNGEALDMDAVSALLLGIVAMRLVRRLCPDCRIPDDRPETQMALSSRLGEQGNQTAYQAGLGCPRCGHAGYRGRIMIYEILPMTAAVRMKISQGASTREIAAFLPPDATLWASGLKRVAAGLTSLEEVTRVVTEDD